MAKRKNWLIVSIISVVFFAVIFSIGLCFGLQAKNAFAYESDGTMTMEKLEKDAKQVSGKYLDVFSIPTAMFDYSNNGGERDSGGLLKFAFDRDFVSCFKSKTHNGKITDPQTNEQVDFRNYIDVDFKKTFTIDRIVYQCEDWYGYGYPKQLKVFANNEQGQLEQVGYLKSTQSNDMFLMSFVEPITTDKIRLYWEDTHAGYISAREIIFLVPESEDGLKAMDLFSDFGNFKVNPEIHNKDELQSLKESVKNFPGYENVLSELFNRAELIFDGVVKYDARREFSTAADAVNLIERRGNVVSHMRSELKIKWLGTNRVPTGISINAGQVLNIYVDAPENEKNLPKIAYTQFWGHWSSWNSGEIQLKRGKNTIEARNFMNDKYSIRNIVLGGPVYLVNPYNEDEQSDKVKVYIEGGTVFPVFHFGDDEKEYKAKLKDYVELVNQNPEQIVNCTELVSNRVIMTVRATVADEMYETFSAQQNLVNWNTYMEQLLEFEGISTTAQGKHYNKMNDYINCNFRLMQPYGAAYAYTEHIGIQPDWERTAIFGGGYGWGYTHEIGHMIEISEREIGEITNNMLSKYYETAVEKTATRGSFDATLKALSSDVDLPASFFSDSELNFLVWWYLESYHIGFWSELENHYRYTNSEGLKNTEKQVYYSSLIMGFDMSYYYERWGYHLNEQKYFSSSTVSDEFKAAMQKAKDNGLIQDHEKLKFWYLDSKEYLLVKDGHTNLYSLDDKPTLNSVTKTSEGYFIRMSEAKSSNLAHLGFEIIEGRGENAKVVGFTHTNQFVDTTSYPHGYTPEYSVVAYDRGLHVSSPSDIKSATEQNAVVRLNNTYYSSLSEAIVRAETGDTIYLLKDIIETGIVVDRDINIVVDDSVSNDITISRSGAGDIFVVNAGAHLTLTGKENAKIIIDGNKIKQKGALIKLTGYANLSYVVLKNNINENDGAGLLVDGGSGSAVVVLSASHVDFIENTSLKNGGAVYNNISRKTLNFSHCNFTSNSAKVAGGIYNIGTMTIDASSFTQNSATGNCGAICNIGGGVMTISNTTIKNNSAVSGAGLYLDGKTDISNCLIESNIATNNGGGVFFEGGNSKRQLSLLDETIISSNSAANGSALFVNNGIANINGAKIENNGESNEFAINANVGTLNIYKTSIINENLKRGASGAIVLYDGVFNTSKAKIEVAVDGLVSGSLILKAANFDFDEEIMQLISVKTGATEIEAKKNLLATIQEFEVRVTINGSTTTHHVLNGNVFTLEEESANQKIHILSYTANGKSYTPGQEVEITANIEFVANVEDKMVVKLQVGSNSEEVYVVKNEYYSLPAKSNQNVGILSWENENKTYYPYQSVLINSAKTFTATTNNQLKIDFKRDGTYFETRYYNYGEYLIFPEVQGMPRGRELDFWAVENSNEKLQNGLYKITKNATLNATTKVQRLLVSYVFDTGEVYKEFEVDFGTKIKLEMPTEFPLGHEFAHFVYLGDEVEVGHEINVENAVSITIALQVEKLNITYKQSGDEIEWIQNYGDELKLELLGPVPEGKELDCFLVNNVKHELNDIISITEDTEIVVKFKPIMLQITYMIDGEVFEVVEVEYGTDYTLGISKSVPKGYKVDHYVLHGVDREKGFVHTIINSTVVDVVLQKKPVNTLVLLISVLGGAALLLCAGTVGLLIYKKKKKI